jgi:hypothetical protein
MWTDTLKLEEVVGSLRAAERLKTVSWAAGLLSKTKPILDRLRVGLNDKDAYAANPIAPAEISFLFESASRRQSPLLGCPLNMSIVPP